MATFYCAKCKERMCNSSDDNTFEHYLIKSNIYNLEQGKYDKLVSKVNKEYKENQRDPEFGDHYKDIDTWFDVCFELGSDAWVCPKCGTMYVFGENGHEVERVYVPVDKDEWFKKYSDKN